MEKCTNFFSEKRKIINKLTPVDNKENTIFEDQFVSEKFFESATNCFQINENYHTIDTYSNKINSVEKAVKKYRNYPSILLIKSRL